MAIRMKGRGLKISRRAKAARSGLMALCMRGNMWPARRMAMGGLIGEIRDCMKENSRIIRWMVRGLISGLTNGNS